MNYCSLAHDCAKLFVSFQLSTFFCSRVMDMHGAGELCVVSFWATVCKTVRPTLSVRCLACPVCLSVLSVTFVHCGQKVGRIKMKLGTQVGLGPCHIVLDGDPFSPPQGGGGRSPPIIGPYLLWPSGWMDQDATWYGGSTWPRRLCVRWGHSSLLPQKGRSPLSNFRHMSIVAKRLDGSRWHFW